MGEQISNPLVCKALRGGFPRKQFAMGQFSLQKIAPPVIRKGSVMGWSRATKMEPMSLQDLMREPQVVSNI